MKNGQTIDPAPLFDIAVAYWRSSVLFTALDLDLFSALGDDQQSTASLSNKLSLPERSLNLFLNALKALNLVTIEEDCVRNTPLTRMYLCKDRDSYIGEAIMFNAKSYPAWGKLTKAVSENKPAIDPNHFLGKDKEATRNFVVAMHNRAKTLAPVLVNLLPFSQCQRLLDLGGGPATYSVMLTEKFPQLTATVFDLPEILEVTKELIRNSSTINRIDLCPGDVFKDEFGSGFNAILVSGLLHRTEGESTLNLLKKAASALRPKGIIAISDLFTGGENQSVVLPELFSIHMMLTANEGQTLHLPDMPGILDKAGLKLTQVIPYPPPLPHTLCLAEKKE